MSENLIEINDLSAGYGGVPVVRGLSLTVKAGEVVALLGPNGAGKTTTLLTISGILRPLGGAVTVLGQPVLGGKAFRIARRGLATSPRTGRCSSISPSTRTSASG